MPPAVASPVGQGPWGAASATRHTSCPSTVATPTRSAGEGDAPSAGPVSTKATTSADAPRMRRHTSAEEQDRQPTSPVARANEASATVPPCPHATSPPAHVVVVDADVPEVGEPEVGESEVAEPEVGESEVAVAVAVIAAGVLGATVVGAGAPEPALPHEATTSSAVARAIGWSEPGRVMATTVLRSDAVNGDL